MKIKLISDEFYLKFYFYFLTVNIYEN